MLIRASDVERTCPTLPVRLLSDLAALSDSEAMEVMCVLQVPNYKLLLLQTGDPKKPAIVGTSSDVDEPDAQKILDLAKKETTQSEAAEQGVWVFIQPGLWKREADRQGRAFYAIEADNTKDAVLVETSTLMAMVQRIHQLETELRVTQNEKMTDELTGLRNRRAFNLESTTAARQAERDVQDDKGHKTLGLLMFDIDHFKRFNDTYGHRIGDLVLQHVSKLVKQTIRTSDTAYRVGGEEFALLGKVKNKKGLMILAEKIRRAVENPQNALFHPSTGEALSITISLGATLYTSRNSHAEDGQDILAVADLAMYKAKNGWTKRDGTRVGPRNNAHYMVFSARNLKTAKEMKVAERALHPLDNPTAGDKKNCDCTPT